MASKQLKGPIALAGNGKEYPALSLVRYDPGLAATLSKLIPGREAPRYNAEGNRTPEAPNVFQMREVANTTARNINDAKTVMQILPDTELAAQILVSSILSPKDMMTTELTYMAPEGRLPPDVASAMTNRVRQHFEQDYKIKPLLQAMLRDPLFETGSYAVAVIPENSIDEAINGQRSLSMESLADELNRDGTPRNKGLLGPVTLKTPAEHRTKPGLAVESLAEFKVDTNHDGRITFEQENGFGHALETYLSVTDNFSALKIPQINHKIREQQIVKAIGSTALESITRLNDRELTALTYKHRQFNYTPIAALKTQEQLNRRTVGEPLILHLPSESVIPVYVPGSPDQHVGYFVLIDGDGNPIRKSDDTDYYQQLNARMNTGGSFPSAMLQKLRQNMDGFNCSDNSHLDYSARVFGDMVEQDLLARLRNGKYGNGLAIARREEIYRVMLARALAKQHTQLLFMPIQLMTYIAFRYNADGIGTSMLDEMKVLNSLRSMLMFANVMAGVKNSIGRTEVKLKLDERDPDPQKSIERLMHEILRTRQQAFPVGTNSPMDITDYLTRAGMEFSFEGHPGLPDVQVEFGEKNTNYTKPDTELEESLRKRAIMAFGMSPETVDATFQAEFATSVVTNNILLSKRVMQTQEQFTPQLSDHLRKVVMNSENLIKDLEDILKSHEEKLVKRIQAAEQVDGGSADQKRQELPAHLIVKQMLYDFVMNFQVELPRPNSVTLENQMAALKTYKEGLDEVIDAYISNEFLNSDTVGDLSNHIESLKSVIKAYFIRKYMAENGIMTELSDLIGVDEDGKPLINLYDEVKDHVAAITKSLGHFMEGVNVTKQAANKLNEKLEQTDTTESTNAPEAGSSNNSGTDDGGFGGGDDGFGFDDGDDGSLDMNDDGLTPPDGAENGNPDETSTEGGEGNPEGGENPPEEEPTA